MNHPHYPNVLMTTEAVTQVLNDPHYRIVEVDLDPDAYSQGHLPGAIKWNWERQLRNPRTFEILTPDEFAELLGRSGIGAEDKVVLYGDNNNWFACWAFWLMHMVGHQNVWLMDGGARRWHAEGREASFRNRSLAPVQYPPAAYDLSDKASTDNVFEAFFQPESYRLVDVRSSAEFEGKALAPAGTRERCAVGGHIPTAINIPWNLNCRADGTFKSIEELRHLYANFDVGPETTVITYCAIGERASLSWFVLKMLLDFPVVMNYDRSMAHWSRLANAPLISGEAA